MYSAALSANDMQLLGPLDFITSAARSVASGVASVATGAAKLVYKGLDASKGVVVAGALCQMNATNRANAARLAGVDINKLNQFCSAYTASDYVTLMLLLPDMLKILKASNQRTGDSAIDMAVANESAARGATAAGVPKWVWYAGGAAALVVVGIWATR